LNHAVAESIERWNPSWKNRRRTIFATLSFCAAVIAYIVWKDSGSSLHAEVASSLTMLAGFIIGSYVFGAVYQDTKLREPR